MFIKILSQHNRYQRILAAAHNQQRRAHVGNLVQIVIAVPYNQIKRQRHRNNHLDHIVKAVERNFQNQRGKRLFPPQVINGIRCHIRPQRHSVNDNVAVLITETVQIFDSGQRVRTEILLSDNTRNISKSAVFRHKSAIAGFHQGNHLVIKLFDIIRISVHKHNNRTTGMRLGIPGQKLGSVCRGIFDLLRRITVFAGNLQV